MADPKRAMLEIRPQYIPQALKTRKQWVLWKLEARDGEDRSTKVPYQANGHRASTKSTSTWGAFNDLWLIYDTMGGYSGVAYVMAEKDPYTGIDLDHCIDEDGNVEPLADNIVKQLNSYTEISPSGKGIRIFVKATKPGDRCRTAKRPGIEIYSRQRLLSLTGHCLLGTPETIEKRQAELEELYNEIFPPEEESQNCGQPGISTLEDEVLIEKALNATNGEKFRRLFVLGDTSDYVGDHSGADLGLCNHLAFWTGRDAAQMDKLFRNSALMRPKWDEKRGSRRYGEMTIYLAISNCSETYKPAKAITQGDGVGDDGHRSLSDAQLALDEIKDELMADPHRIKDPDVLRDLLVIREGDPIEYAILAKELPIEKGALKKALDLEAKKKGTAPAIELPRGKFRGEEEDEVKICFDDVADIELKENGEIASIKFNPAKASETILKKFEVLTTRGARAKDPLTTWIYDEESGLFVPDGEFRIKAIINQVAGNLFTLNMAAETIAKIQYESIGDLDELDSDPYLFPVADKVINLQNGEVLDHSPDLKLTSKSPIFYNPEAKCPAILRFLSESLADPRDVLTVIDMFVVMAIRRAFDLFVILLGQGSNGKLVLESLIEAFFGHNQVTAVRLEIFHRNQFSLGELIGKRALINSEVSGTAKESDWMKRIASGDPIDTDVKHAGHILFRPFCLQIFDCNNPPQFHDSSFGLARRLLKLDFPFKFVDNPDPDNLYEKKRDPNLKEKITTDEELSGLLNLIIARAPDIIKSWTIYRRAEAMTTMAEYSKQSRNMESFVEECCEVDLDDYTKHTTPTEIYETYKQYCEICNIAPVSETQLGRYITSITGQKSVTENGIRYRHFIRIKENAIKNKLEQFRTGLEQDNHYQEQVEQVSNQYLRDIVKKILEKREIHSNKRIEEKIPQKPVEPVLPVPAIDKPVQDPFSTRSDGWTCSGGDRVDYLEEAAVDADGVDIEEHDDGAEPYIPISQAQKKAKLREVDWLEHVRTPDPTARPVDRSDTQKESDIAEEVDHASAAYEKTDPTPLEKLENDDHERTRLEELSDPGDVSEGLIFDQSVSYFSNLSGSQGLTAARLRKELGWDIEKAKMALELLRTMYNWQLTVFGEHKIYLPPSYSESSASSCP